MNLALSPPAIEALLHEEIVARIAYIDRRGKPYIVPITYAYDGEAIFGYSLLGAKIEGMTIHPEVCIEVDRVRDIANWESVVARGMFELLTGPAALGAVERVADRMRAIARAGDAPASAERSYVANKGGPGVAFRVRIFQKVGRTSVASQPQPDVQQAV